MWILDTNVVSELVAMKPSAAVVARVRALAENAVFTTAISEAEIFYGIERLPMGRRRDHLRAAMEATFSEDFAGRVLPFNSAAARIYGRLLAERRTVGRPMSQSDVQIAAIAIEHNATLVTRNTRDFANSDIALLNPWLA
jgi:predicted nucleic acid-binding protein